MSKLSDQQLDDLFKGHLLDLEKDPPVGSWQTLAKGVTKNNFLKSGWKHFNIFYAGIAVVSLSAGIYFTVLNIPSKENNPIQQNRLPIIVDTLEKKTSTPLPQESTIKNPESNNLLQKKNPASVIASDPVEISSTETKKDSIIAPLENSPEIKLPEPEKKESAPKAKKIITVIRRDTIRVKDTINKERIRW